MRTNTAEKLFSSTINFILLDDDTLNEAKKRFNEFQKAGVIKPDCNFTDSVWNTTDEYSNIGFHFEFNEFCYEEYRKMIGVSFQDFLTYLKSYMIFIFGKKVLSSINDFLIDIRHIISISPVEICGVSENLTIWKPGLCAEFFSTVAETTENEELDILVSAFESYAEINLAKIHVKQRELADFDTYLKFNDLLKDYWNSAMPEDERLFFYPLYLWWNVTGVIPLRPREFLLTERNCLKKDNDGRFFLKLRRNHLKGTKEKQIAYKISTDYTVDTYRIPDWLGLEIEKYQHLTDKYESTRLDTLFITDMHYKKWSHKKRYDSRFLTYINMRTILRYFYREIIGERYGLKIRYIAENSHLADDEIGYIQLGDTRHISLINIMLEGGTPATAMFLAGHANSLMASHYYSNLKNLIECKTYRLYRKQLKGTVEYQISELSTLPTVKEFKVLEDGGKCFSQAFLNESLEDCMNSIGPNGELGFCPSCSKYRSGGRSYFDGDSIYTRQLEEDCSALVRAIETVRSGKGCLEDVGEELLKLHSSSISYEQYLLEKEANKNHMED